MHKASRGFLGFEFQKIKKDFLEKKRRPNYRGARFSRMFTYSVCSTIILVVHTKRRIKMTDNKITMIDPEIKTDVLSQQCIQYARKDSMDVLKMTTLGGIMRDIAKLESWGVMMMAQEDDYIPILSGLGLLKIKAAQMGEDVADIESVMGDMMDGMAINPTDIMILLFAYFDDFADVVIFWKIALTMRKWGEKIFDEANMCNNSQPTKI